jgi:3-oxoacyl-[acyl-carrier protein] reductase
MLEGRNALVTGSSRGIGATIARTLAAHGAAVAVHSRDEAAARQVADDIVRRGGRAISVAGDVTRFADLEAMRTRIERELGPVDVLVANAGGSPTQPGALEDVSEEQWRDAIDGNLTATFLTIKSFLPGMKERGVGNIVTVSSAAGRVAHPRAPVPYAVAKCGIALLTKDVAMQAGPRGVRANCVAPETIMTERLRDRIPAAQQQTMADAHPIRRLGSPEDVAQAVLFLVSDQSAWITGVTVDVTGGAVMV